MKAAVIGIGSNSVRMLLAEMGPEGFQRLERDREGTRLFAGLGPGGRLSEESMAHTAAAVGVAAHEAGHAVQYAVGYSPIRIRQAVIPATKIGTYAAWPLFIAGMIFSAKPLQLAGILLFSACVLFQLLTLPVEVNASRRAVNSLEQAGLSDEGLKAAKSVLTAAALTYVAALASAIANLLRLVALFNSGSRRR